MPEQSCEDRRMRGLAALVLSIAILTGCGAAGGPAPKSSGSAAAGVVLGAAALAGLFLVYGLIACADENGGACTIPIGGAEESEERPGRVLDGG